MFSPSPITTTNPEIAGKQQIARIARRIIARNYGLIDQILNIVVESNGLIKVWFQDDNVERSVILMTIGDTVEYRDITNRRTDSITKAVDWYIVSFANNIHLREDAIRKPKNCKKGTPCKGECIPKGSICRDIPVAKDEAIAINEAVAKSVPQPVVTEPENSDPYRDLNIRQLKEVAREKGVMRYSYMTQGQLRDAINVYDANPDYRENIRKGLQRQKDEATLKKVKTTEIGRALSTVDPKLGRQYNLINAIAKKNEKNPAEARIYALATILSTSALIAKTMEKRRADNLNEAKVMATANASDIRESTPEVKEPSVTFVVGSYGKGSNALANALKNSKNISDEDKAWLENETKLIPFKRSKEGVASATDPVRAFADNFATGYKAAIGNAIDNGKGDEAIALASQLYVHGSKYSLDRDGLLSSPALNVLAGEDGGTVARDAIEILRKMPKSPDSNGIRGTDIADRVRLVTLGTPYFGLAKPDVPEANIMGNDDLWNLTPFTKGGNETRKVSGVGSSGQSSYVESSDAMNIAFKHLRTVQEERRKINPESIKARDAAIKEKDDLAKAESDRTEQEKARIIRDQKKAADLKVLADRVRVELEPLAKKEGKTVAQFIDDNKGLVSDITAKEKEKIAKERAKARIGDEVAKVINTDSAIYLLARSDAYKKLKCKADYVQRGAACQKEKDNGNNQEKDNVVSLKKNSNNFIPIAASFAALIGVSLATYFATRASYRSGFPKSAEEASKKAADINASVKPEQHSVIFSVGGLGYAKESPEVISGERLGYAASKAFSDSDGKDIKFVPINNKETNYPEDKTSTDGSFPPADVAALYWKQLANGRSKTAVDLAANVIAYGDKYPDKTLVMMGHSKGGFDVHEAQEIIRLARPEFESRLKSFAIGTQYYGFTENFGESHTIGSEHDFFTSQLPTKNLKQFNNVKGHTQEAYLRDPDVREFVKGVIYKGKPSKEERDQAEIARKEANKAEQKIKDQIAAEKKAVAKAEAKAKKKEQQNASKFVGDSLFYSTHKVKARNDAFKKLKCKTGYIQRGAACQKQVNSLTPEPRVLSKVSPPNNAIGNFLKFGLPIASVAAIVLAAKSTVEGDVSKVKANVKGKEIVKPNETASKETLEKYEKNFKPGDLIKQSFSLDGDTYFDHYAIYAGEGYVIETDSKKGFGGSTVLKQRIDQPSGAWKTEFSRVDDDTKGKSVPSKEQALSMAESLVGVPFKFDGVDANCESFARLITQGSTRSTQGEKLSWFTRSIAKTMINTMDKEAANGFSLQEISKIMTDNNYDPILVKSVFKDSVTKRANAIARKTKPSENKSDSSNRLEALRSPDEFAAIVNKTIAPLNGASKTIVEQGMYKAYLVATIALVSKKNNANK